MKEKKKAVEHLPHIKKKTLFKVSFTEDQMSQMDKHLVSIDDAKKLKPRQVKHTDAMIFNDQHEGFSAFAYDYNGIACFVPLANPVLIYFNTAQLLIKPLADIREQLLKRLIHPEKMNEDGLFEFYQYFGVASNFVTQLTNSIEAFVNQKIPRDHVHIELEGKRYTKHFDYDQIQRELKLETKIAEILNKVTKKNFEKNFGLDQVHLKNLWELRNDIVHTKSKDGVGRYEDLYRKTLNFKFLETAHAVKRFINYYEEHCIESCDCGKDL